MFGQSFSPIGQPPPPRSPRTLTHEQADRPIVGYAREFAAADDTGRHAHLRAQLLSAVRGVLRVQTDAAGYVVPPGAGLYVPAQVAHAVRMDGAVAMRALFLRADAARAAPPQVAVIALSPLLRALIDAACAEPPEWDLHGRGVHLAALMQDEIARAASLPLGLPAPRDQRLRRVTEALVARPDDPRDLDAFAAAAGASARTLARLFRRETGMSFRDWRRQLRLTEALVLLHAGTPPARAAAAVGYRGSSAFGAALRAVFGVAPGQVRSLAVRPPGAIPDARGAR
jgi:AraC-like DNA-binding protein/quercetin dioxygenase-like cupin family protein